MIGSRGYDYDEGPPPQPTPFKDFVALITVAFLTFGIPIGIMFGMAALVKKFPVYVGWIGLFSVLSLLVINVIMYIILSRKKEFQDRFEGTLGGLICLGIFFWFFVLAGILMGLFAPPF